MNLKAYIARICMQTGRKDKAKLLLDYNLSQKLIPNVLDRTKEMTVQL